MKINEDKTREAFESYGKRFGLDMVMAGEGVCSIANHKMADAIRELTVRRGIDPRNFSILAFGGAGPMHAALIAEELDIEEVIVPANPGVFSAWGMLQADIRHDAAVTSLCLLDSLEEEEYDRNFELLKEDLQEVLEKEGIARQPKQYICSLDMRYFGQEYTISVDMPGGMEYCRDYIEEQFNGIYERLYGHHSPDDRIEVVNYRVTVVVPVRKSQTAGREGVDRTHVIGQIPGYFDGVQYDMNVYARDDLVTGSMIEGPAIIVELTSTTVVPPKWKLVADKAGSMIITKM